MATITLPHETSAAHVAAVRALVEQELLTNPNLSGAEIEVDTDIDCYSPTVDGLDEIVGAQLLNAVNDTLHAAAVEVSK